ncbi:hypothetical protein [Microcystis sp. M169S2]|uniref:hypothetical protein n=1 Tax=Microcystis sp. M169S2 TaxID=2771157 RepID=UPI000CEA1809|nr:hypothetical protein [Microcystis sp. M169S2]
MEKYLETFRSWSSGDRIQETGDRRLFYLFSPHPTPHTPDIPIEMALSALIIPNRATKGRIWETLQYTGSHRG